MFRRQVGCSCSYPAAPLVSGIHKFEINKSFSMTIRVTLYICPDETFLGEEKSKVTRNILTSPSVLVQLPPPSCPSLPRRSDLSWAVEELAAVAAAGQDRAEAAAEAATSSRPSCRSSDRPSASEASAASEDPRHPERGFEFSGQ